MGKRPGPPPLRTPKRATPDARIPRRVMRPTPNDHLEIITRAIFQAGLSWAMIDARWPAFRSAFDGFVVARIARYDELQIERLMTTDGIVHSAKKIAGTIANAQTLIALSDEFGSIERYLECFPSYGDLLVDAQRRFAFLGDLSCYYWLFRVGAPVPLFETWIERQAKDHPRMREMVLAGRADGTSTERS
jgi:hypothetical protein